MWKYAIKKQEWGYAICEDLGKYGYTEPVIVDGETPEEVIETLRMMLADVV